MSPGPRTVRVLYSIGRLPELATQFAATMHQRHGWEPVYWITQPELHAEVGELFPAAARHPFSDANRGIAAAGMEWTMHAPLGADDMARAAPFEARAMEIIDRHVLANGMEHGERRAFYHQMLAWAFSVVDTMRVERFVVASTPHVIADICLYAACVARGAGVRMLHLTGLAGSQVVLHDIDGPPAGLADALDGARREQAEPELSAIAAEELAKGGDAARFTVPWYVERQQQADEKLRHLQEAADFVLDHGLASWEGVRFDRPVEVPKTALAGRKLGIPSERGDSASGNRQPKTFGRRLLNVVRRAIAGGATGGPSAMINIFRRRITEQYRTEALIRSFARPGVPFSGPRITKGEYYTYRDWALLRKTAFKRGYDSLAVEPADAELAGQPFVYFPLHYQPERTTCPDGGAFNDQFLAASLLAHALPEGWRLLVKEHPSQFKWQTEGELGRWDGYYERFLGLPNTLLVSTRVASERLILASRAVATITGMAGWEAVMLGRPAIVFGNAWYADCAGATQVGTLAQAREALARAAAGDGPDPVETRRFAAAIEAIGERCYINPSHATHYPELDEAANCAALCALFARAEALIAAEGNAGDAACGSSR